MESLSDYDALSKEMFEHIKKVEGNSGDTTGVAETGKYGLTTDTYNHIKNMLMITQPPPLGMTRQSSLTTTGILAESMLSSMIDFPALLH